MKIKVISLWQPWAQMVALGHKKNETRSWYTPHRGVLGIHATASMSDLARKVYNSPQFYNVLRRNAYDREETLPKGAIVALVTLSQVLQIVASQTVSFNEKIYCRAPGPPEYDYGDYTAGRYAWKFSERMQLFDPIPATGRQLLWDWECPDDIYEQYVRSEY